MMNQAVKVRREALAAGLICPLCNKLLREATTISLCLHTFCRKCIYEKLSDEEVDSCPVCNIDLGCVPVEKLRPDHNLQDIRATIFPFKRRKIKAPDIVPSVSVPVKRKERSLSSLVVSTPKVSMQTGLTGRRTKAAARKISPVQGTSFSSEELIKQEGIHREDCPESSGSPEKLNKIVQDKRQISSSAKSFPDQLPNEDKANVTEAFEGNVDLWKPLNCLVEAANRTKSSKLSLLDSSSVKSEPIDAPDYELHVPKMKAKLHQYKCKVQGDKNGKFSLPGLAKRKRLGAVDWKRTGGESYNSLWSTLEDWKRTGGGSYNSLWATFEAQGAKENRRKCPIWFSLVASEDQEGDIALPQIPACYLRIKDADLPVSFIQKYLAKKLNLKSEAEVEILCHGQPVIPSLQLGSLVDLWLQTTSTSNRVAATEGGSAKDFVMVLCYARKVIASP